MAEGEEGCRREGVTLPPILEELDTLKVEGDRGGTWQVPIWYLR